MKRTIVATLLVVFGFAGLFALVSSIRQASKAVENTPEKSSSAKEYPKRVVSLAPSVTEIVFELGKGDLLVGRTSYCDRPKEAQSIPIVADYLAPDIERVVAAKPDLVIASKGPGNKGAVEKLVSIGLRTETVSEYTVEEVLGAIKQIGAALGAEEKATLLIATIRRNLDDVKAKASQMPPVRTLFVIDRNPIVLAAEGSLPGELLKIAGGVNLAPVVAGKTYVSIEKEKLSTLKPDVLIDANLMDGKASPSAKDDLAAMYRTIPGWEGGVRIEFTENDAVYLPGAHIDEGAQVIFSLLHIAQE